MRTKFVTTMLAVSALAGVMFACTPGGGGGGSAAMMANLPDAEYDMIFSMKPNELLNAGFVTNIKEKFPMSQLFFAQLESQADQSGMQLADIDTVLGATAGYETLVFTSGTFDQAAAKQALEENMGLTLEEVDIEGQKVWMDADYDRGMLFLGNMAVMANKEGMEKVVACTADPEKSFVNGETYAKLGKYFDAGATMSFMSSEVADFDPAMMAQSMADEGDDEETISNLTAAAEKMEGFAGSFRISDAINGKVFMLFSEADAATTFADYFNSKKMTAFEQMADQAEQMTQMMPTMNPDREKILALADKINFGTEGNALRMSVDIAWSDIAFLFEGGDQ